METNSHQLIHFLSFSIALLSEFNVDGVPAVLVPFFYAESNEIVRSQMAKVRKKERKKED